MKLVKSLYFQILLAVLLGALVGHVGSQQAIALKPLGDAFIKMMIAPVVFCTIVTGIAGMSDKRSLGRGTRLTGHG